MQRERRLDEGSPSATGRGLEEFGKAGAENGEEEDDEESPEWSEEISMKVVEESFTSSDMAQKGKEQNEAASKMETLKYMRRSEVEA